MLSEHNEIHLEQQVRIYLFLIRGRIKIIWWTHLKRLCLELQVACTMSPYIGLNHGCDVIEIGETYSFKLYKLDLANKYSNEWITCLKLKYALARCKKISILSSCNGSPAGGFAIVIWEPRQDRKVATVSELWCAGVLLVGLPP